MKPKKKHTDEKIGDQADAMDKPAEKVEAAPADDVDTLSAKVAALEDNLLRAKADFQNLQRRAAVERSEAIRYANADLMQSLLGVIDDLERSIAAAEDSEHSSSMLDGVRLVHANLLKALSSSGLEVIDAQHQAFDPTIHEALLQQSTTQCKPGTVVEQVSKGYRLRDRIIRPAKVIVAKAPDGAQETTEAESTTPRDHEPVE